MRALSGRIAVLGVGVTGAAVSRYLLSGSEAESGASVTIYDERDVAAQGGVVAELRALGASVKLGASAVDDDYDLVIASPGIPPSSLLLRSARERSQRVVGEIEFAYERSRSPWLAVTGTNGKTTVTSLCAHLLRYAGVPTECVGNIGDPAIAVVGEVGPSAVLVAEVSSFQLALTEDFHPRVAVLLNITPDHIDWHGSMEAYAADKARVFSNMGPGDTAVIDVDDAGASAYVDSVVAAGVSVVRVSLNGVPAGGAGVEDGVLVLDTDHGRLRLARIEDLQIRGDHNVSNALAAAAAVHAFGVGADGIAKGLREFVPIHHRLQPVGVVDDVEYINDSKATNPGATNKALAAFEDRPVVLLAGGRNKGNDFADLADAVAGCRAIVAFGESSGEIADALASSVPRLETAASMIDALGIARAMAQPGDVVLLSPACASFDEFSGYAHRGDVFSDAVMHMSGGLG